MNKIQLIFSIKQEIQKQAPTQDGIKFVHGQDIEIEIAKAYEAVVNQFFMSPDLKDNFDLDYFSKTYEGTVKQTSSKQLYVDLPTKPIALPGGLGVRMIRPKDSDVYIIRMSESEFINLKNLETFCCSPNPFCYIDNHGNRIVLQGNRPEYNLLDQLTIKLLPKFSGFNDEEEINTPGGDYQLSQMVMELMGIRPTDNTNDDGQ